VFQFLTLIVHIYAQLSHLGPEGASSGCPLTLLIILVLFGSSLKCQNVPGLLAFVPLTKYLR
jgi:hypothetical protein